MEWLKKLLEGKGLSEEVINSIVEGVEVNYKGYVPHHRFEEVNTAKKAAEDALKDRDKQLEDLKKSTGDAEALKQQIAQLQADNKTAKEKHEAEAKNLRTETALKLKLAGKVHENALSNVIAEFNKEIIELDDNGEIKAGFDDQFKSLQESKGFYFVPESPGPSFKGFKPFDGATPTQTNNNNNIGKMLAQQSKQAGADTAKAQANYFGGMNNE